MFERHLPGNPKAMLARALREAPDSLQGVEDAELARMVAAGDETAFEALFDRHHRGLLSLCRHMLGSREEAEDALQHTFTAAYQQLAAGDLPTRLRPWLYAVARNRCISLIRARRELPSDELRLAAAGLSEEVERRADLRELVADIGRLPDDQRAALVLSELHDLQHDEVAEAIGCRQEKVRALVYQARSSLAGWRAARETPCREVREHIASASGGALRRASIQRHLKVCDDCTAFRDAVTRQRRRVALVLPVLATPLLKERVLEAAAHAAAEGAAGAAAGGGAVAGGAAAADGAVGGAAAGGAAAEAGAGAAAGGGAAVGGGAAGAAAGGALAGAGKIAAVAVVVAGGAGLGALGLTGGDGAEGQRQAQPPDQAQVAADQRAERRAAERRLAERRLAQRRGRAERRRAVAARRAAAGRNEQVRGAGAPAQPATASGAQPVPPAPAEPAPPAPAAPAPPAAAPAPPAAAPLPQTPQPQQPPPAQPQQPAVPEPDLPEADGEIEAVPAEPQAP